MADLVKTVCLACNGTGKRDMGPLNFRKIMCQGCNGSGYLMKPEEEPVHFGQSKDKPKKTTRGKYAKQGEKKSTD